MTKLITLLAAAAVLLASASSAYAVIQGDISLDVTLGALNGSGETGTAELHRQGNTTVVTVNLVHVPGGANQPMHIHTGHCGLTLGGVKAPLTNAHRIALGYGNTTTTTVLNEPITDFTHGNFAINVHQSPSNLAHYMSCGNLP